MCSKCAKICSVRKSTPFENFLLYSILNDGVSVEEGLKVMEKVDGVWGEGNGKLLADLTFVSAIC